MERERHTLIQIVRGEIEGWGCCCREEDRRDYSHTDIHTHLIMHTDRLTQTC